MTTACDNLEASLVHAFTRESECTAAAIALSGSLAELIETRQNPQPILDELQTLFDEVASLRSGRDLRYEQWRALGRPTPRALSSAVSRLRELLPDLIKVIEAAELAAASHCRRLRPEINSEVRSMQMLNAYGTTADAS